MRILMRLVVVTLALVLSGCLTPSIHPLYTDEDLVFEDSLVGTWSDDDQAWTFRSDDEGGYRLTVLDDGEESKLIAHLVQLGEHRFLDLYPEDPDCESCWYYLHMLPVHTFSRATLQGDVLELAFMDAEWLKDKSEAGELGLAHEFRDDQVVLTAGTGELQEFVLGHLDEVFDQDDSGVLHREDSRIPLIRAVRNGQIDSLRTLLAAGGEVEERDGLGHTPLMWAAREGNKAEILKLLIGSGADLEATDLEGRTALIRAAQTGRDKTLLLLLAAGASLEARDDEGLTPLMWAARNGHHPTAEKLLAAGADASASDPSGLTPLLWAARNGHGSVVKLLGMEEKGE